MLRLLFISDFTESFAYNLLNGIVNYTREHDQWEICRMPPGYMKKLGTQGLIDWAKNWEADAIIGQFDQNVDMEQFNRNGIVVVAQDYKKRFSTIPNITADYIGTGRMGAEHFLDKGFTNFGYFGLRDVCWSDERCYGFRKRIEEAGYGSNFYTYNMQDIDNLWYYERTHLAKWLQDLPKPIAIMACDDNQGSNLIDACNSLSIKIPSEIAVLGVDNDEMVCKLNTPSLSSIRVNIEDGGYQTAALIERLVKYPDSGREDVVLCPIKVVGRISTAAFATGDEEIQKAIKFIHQNLQRKISVEDVLKEVALSRRLLERRFKAVTGESVYQYVTKQKMDLFANMLLDTNDQVINIAISLGENDSKSIARRFKAIYGCAPNEWREKNKKILH